MYLVTSLSLPGFRALIYADIRCSANRVRTECVCALLTRARGTCVIYIISVCVIYVVSGITGRQQTTGHQTLGPPWQAHRSSSSAAPSRLRVERPDPRAVFVCVPVSHLFLPCIMFGPQRTWHDCMLGAAQNFSHVHTCVCLCTCSVLRSSVNPSPPPPPHPRP